MPGPTGRPRGPSIPRGQRGAARPRPHSPSAEVAGSRRRRCRRCRPAPPLRQRPRLTTPTDTPSRVATPRGDGGRGGHNRIGGAGALLRGRNLRGVGRKIPGETNRKEPPSGFRSPHGVAHPAPEVEGQEQSQAVWKPRPGGSLSPPRYIGSKAGGRRRPRVLSPPPPPRGSAPSWGNGAHWCS